LVRHGETFTKDSAQPRSDARTNCHSQVDNSG
jgi:hypothetical protein